MFGTILGISDFCTFSAILKLCHLFLLDLHLIHTLVIAPKGLSGLFPNLYLTVKCSSNIQKQYFVTIPSIPPNTTKTIHLNKDYPYPPIKPSSKTLSSQHQHQQIFST